jgi:predicted nuclease of predicted toxin-antitoxin system
VARLLLDENISISAEAGLRAAGHDVAAVGRDAAGLDDRGILIWARREQRVLITFDTDFGDLIFQFGEPPPPAVVLLRMHPIDPAKTLELVAHALAEPIEGAFVVVSEQGLRRRPF